MNGLKQEWLGSRRPEVSVQPLVTQHVLEDYTVLRRQAQKFKGIQKHLHALLEAGGMVEPGRIAARLRTAERRALTEAALVALLGPDEVAALKDQVPIVVYRQLVVTELTHGGLDV